MTTLSKSPSVLLVEDQQLLRLGLKISLERLGCCQILGEVADGEAAVREAQRLRPEVILMDVGLPGIDGIEATWRIKKELPRTRILMFTSHTDQEDVTAALGAGADGYCVKDAPIEQLAVAIHAVMRGEVWLDPVIAATVARTNNASNETTGAPFSEIEKKILTLIVDGVDNLEIANQLSTSAEKITRVLHNIIDRFVDNATTVPRNKPKTEGANEWLTTIVENLDAGTIFAEKYLVENLLGSGGIGAVFKAKHLYMDRYVALKLLRPELSEERVVMRNFQREAIAIGHVQHKNIVGVYDFGISANHEPYLIMEYIDGTNLGDVFEQEHRLPLKRIVNLCLQTCEGLAEAHRKGVVHCDLKPRNILILRGDSEEDETVKLVDFGLAQVLPPEKTVQSQLTDKFFVSGTPLYMSPEQCMGKQLDARSDIYSLGCILFEGLTGEKPFVGSSAMETFAKHIRVTAPTLAATCPGIPFTFQLEYCVAKMLAKAPVDRPQSMREVIQLLTYASA